MASTATTMDFNQLVTHPAHGRRQIAADVIIVVDVRIATDIIVNRKSDYNLN